MKLYLKIWRQTNTDSNGSFQNYEIDEITPDMSFLEMMDVLNELSTAYEKVSRRRLNSY